MGGREDEIDVNWGIQADFFFRLERSVTSIADPDSNNYCIKLSRVHDSDMLTLAEGTLHVFLNMIPMQNRSLVKKGIDART